MSNEDFQKLLERLGRGDSQALEEVVKEYEPSLRGVIRHYLAGSSLRRGHDSSDFLQEVWLRVKIHADQAMVTFEDQLRFRKWLFKVALNAIRDAARRNREDPGNSECGNDVPDQGSSPSQHALREDAVEQVRARLTDEHRKIFDLMVEKGLPWGEIVEQLAIPKHRAHAIRTRFLRHLHQAFDDLGLGQ